MAKNRLEEVYQLGQSIWYDNIQRGLLVSGELQRLIDNDAVTGVTSNPTIFEKAIGGSSDYDDAITALVGQGVTDAGQIFEALAIEDIQLAADLLRPIYDRTDRRDGYISLEVSPLAANDTHRTIREARHLFRRVNRPNVMIKIPATAEGLPAIEQMIYEGVNVNVTLIFSLRVYEKVAAAYIRGLEHRTRDGQPVTGIASVASFFVSRVDTLVDRQLDEKIAATDDEEQRVQLRALQGKAAVANARLAYEKYREIFHGARFATLHEKGAAPQRCLWASTSTKNPAYRDVLYAEELIGPETVDTMPPQTITAFQDHGIVQVTVENDLPGMHVLMDRLAGAGIDMARVTKQLELDGVKAFAESYNNLIASTAAKVEKLREQAAPTGSGISSGGTRQRAELGALQSAVDATLERADREEFGRRVWEKDPALWKPNPEEQSEITDRLGWLTVVDEMIAALPRLVEFREDVRAAGFTHAVLLGMGGSSLAPEVLRRTFGVGEGLPDLIVLDSTDPATLLDVERRIELPRTLFIVASKSGGTIETLSHFTYFYEKVRAIAGNDAGAQFVAITDPDTKLDQLAQSHRFRAIFRNPPDIGGRYSALSYFGLVPAALIGVDVGKLLERANVMRNACQGGVPAHENPGIWLGVIMGTLAQHGRDKVTLTISPEIGTFGYWIEQLIAESTGKEGRGLLPVEGETLGLRGDYGTDRLFVYIRTDKGYAPAQDEAVERLMANGEPVVTLAIADAYDVGAEFFRWEFATAMAGAVIGINAFDQPNVQEAKDNTNKLLAEYAQTGALPQPPALLRTEHVSVVAGGEQARRLADAVSLQAALESFAEESRAGDYLALLAYIERTPETETALQTIRLRLRNLRRIATTLGYGPRFQHSTGQLHKGGPNTGLFIQFVANDTVDAPIPGEPYTFSVLKQAQALGDLQSLQAHGRRVVRVHLGRDIAAGLDEVVRAVEAAR